MPSGVVHNRNGLAHLMKPLNMITRLNHLLSGTATWLVRRAKKPTEGQKHEWTRNVSLIFKTNRRYVSGGPNRAFHKCLSRVQGSVS